MKKFVVERTVPGLGNLSHQALQAISKTCCHVIDLIDQPYHPIQSFVLGDKIFSIHVAESEDLLREHAMLSNLSINAIGEVKML